MRICVGPHMFLAFIAQSRPPQTQSGHNFCTDVIIFYYFIQGCSVSVRVGSCRAIWVYRAVRVGSCRALFRAIRSCVMRVGLCRLRRQSPTRMTREPHDTKESPARTDTDRKIHPYSPTRTDTEHPCYQRVAVLCERVFVKGRKSVILEGSPGPPGPPRPPK